MGKINLNEENQKEVQNITSEVLRNLPINTKIGVNKKFDIFRYLGVREVCRNEN